MNAGGYRWKCSCGAIHHYSGLHTTWPIVVELRCPWCGDSQIVGVEPLPSGGE